jgi:hypothetical protein
VAAVLLVLLDFAVLGLAVLVLAVIGLVLDDFLQNILMASFSWV